MTPSLADVIVHVTAPMHFSGRFVSRDLGGPAAYVPRTYRAPSGGLRLDGNVPFEITLAGDTSMARARLPSPAGDGVLKAKPVESLGYDKKDYDRIVAIK